MSASTRRERSRGCGRSSTTTARALARRRSGRFAGAPWVPEAAAHVTPGVLRWPVLDSWWPAAPATVVYHGSAPAAGVALAGEDAGQFTRAGRRLHRTDAAVHGRGGLCADGTRRPPGAPGDRRHRRGPPCRDAGGLPPRRHDPGGHRGIGGRRGRAARGPRTACLRARERAVLRDRVLAEPDRVAVRPGRRRPRTSGGTSASTREAGRSCRPARATRTRRATRTAPAPASASPAVRRGATRRRARSPSTPSATCRTADCGRSTPASSAAATPTSGPPRGEPGASAPATTSRSRPGWCPGPRPQIDVPPDPVPPPASMVARNRPADRCTASSAARLDGRAARPPRSRRAAGGPRPRASGSAPPRADVLRGTRRADLIRGRAGNDRIYARAGADCVLGGPGNDLLVGGPGRDLLDCGAGRRDRVVAGPGDRVRNCERRLPRRP